MHEWASSKAYIRIANLLAHRLQLLFSVCHERGRVAQRGTVLTNPLCDFLLLCLAHPTQLAHGQTLVDLGDVEAGFAVGDFALVSVQKEVRESAVRTEAAVRVLLEVSGPLLPRDLMLSWLREVSDAKGK